MEFMHHLYKYYVAWDCRAALTVMTAWLHCGGAQWIKKKAQKKNYSWPKYYLKLEGWFGQNLTHLSVLLTWFNQSSSDTKNHLDMARPGKRTLFQVYFVSLICIMFTQTWWKKRKFLNNFVVKCRNSKFVGLYWKVEQDCWHPMTCDHKKKKQNKTKQKHLRQWLWTDTLPNQLLHVDERFILFSAKSFWFIFALKF